MIDVPRVLLTQCLLLRPPQAIEVLGAERIGHGYHVIDDEEVYQLAKEAGVHFEVRG